MLEGIQSLIELGFVFSKRRKTLKVKFAPVA